MRVAKLAGVVAEPRVTARLESANDVDNVCVLVDDCEVLNAAVTGHTFHNYLGVLERMLNLGLDPDLMIVVTYGGNDFLDVYLWHFFAGTRRPGVGLQGQLDLEGDEQPEDERKDGRHGFTLWSPRVYVK